MFSHFINYQLVFWLHQLHTLTMPLRCCLLSYFNWLPETTSIITNIAKVTWLVTEYHASCDWLTEAGCSSSGSTNQLDCNKVYHSILFNKVLFKWRRYLYLKYWDSMRNVIEESDYQKLLVMFVIVLGTNNLNWSLRQIITNRQSLHILKIKLWLILPNV